MNSFPAAGYYYETFISDEDKVGNDFGNWTWATKSGTKFEDLDADGQPREAGEPGLPGWTIYVDHNGNGVWDAGELFDVTDANGDYTINNITPGAFYIREVPQADWMNSFPAAGYYYETFISDEDKVGNDFGNWTWATKSGTKFEDLDADGQPREAGEPGLPGWTIYVDHNGNGVWDAGELFDVTDANGDYTINNITPGAFYIREVPQADWMNSFPAAGYYYETFISDEDKVGNDFGNWTWATKSGYKFYDVNFDGVWDEGEQGLAGWTIYADGVDGGGMTVNLSMTTDADGYYEFSLKPGTYTISEYIPTSSNWEQTAPAGGSYTETFTSGQESLSNDFGNVYWQDETAWGYGLDGYAIPFTAEPMKLKNWGWTNGPIQMSESAVTVEFDLWAGAGGNDLSAGTQVGTGTITYYPDGSVEVVYDIFTWVKLEEIHVWIGNDYLPTKKGNKYTNAPGQFNYNSYTSLGGNSFMVTAPAGAFEGDIYVAAHSVVKFAAEVPPSAPRPPTE